MLDANERLINVVNEYLHTEFAQYSHQAFDLSKHPIVLESLLKGQADEKFSIK